MRDLRARELCKAWRVKWLGALVRGKQVTLIITSRITSNTLHYISILGTVLSSFPSLRSRLAPAPLKCHLGGDIPASDISACMKQDFDMLHTLALPSKLSSYLARTSCHLAYAWKPASGLCQARLSEKASRKVHAKSSYRHFGLSDKIRLQATTSGFVCVCVHSLRDRTGIARLLVKWNAPP